MCLCACVWLYVWCVCGGMCGVSVCGGGVARCVGCWWLCVCLCVVVCGGGVALCVGAVVCVCWWLCVCLCGCMVCVLSGSWVQLVGWLSVWLCGGAGAALAQNCWWPHVAAPRP